MTPIIAGRFEQQSKADEAVVALLGRGFAVEDVTAFHVGTALRQPLHSVHAAEQGEEGRKVGAFRFEADNESHAERPAGILVAARAPDYPKRVIAVNVLETMGALDVERAQGTWEHGS